MRDAESRTRFLGYRPECYKLVVWVLSAVMAGIGGALYVPQVGIINPSEFCAGQLDRGGDLGRGRRPRHAGPARSSARSWSTCGKTYFTGALPELWLYALGAMFILVTLFLPRGDHGPGPHAAASRLAGTDPEADAGAGRGA